MSQHFNNQNMYNVQQFLSVDCMSLDPGKPTCYGRQGNMAPFANHRKSLVYYVPEVLSVLHNDLQLQTFGNIAERILLWCITVVFYCGVLLWNTTVVYYCSVLLWCITTMYYCGVLLWCITVVYYCGVLL